MLSRLDVGQEIPEDMFTAVAVILAWVYWLRGMQPGDEAAKKSRLISFAKRKLRSWREIRLLRSLYHGEHATAYPIGHTFRPSWLGQIHSSFAKRHVWRQFFG